MIPPYKNRLLASDIEANNLLEKVSKIWCLFSIDVMTKEVLLFHDYPEYDNVEVYDPCDKKTYIIPTRTGTLEEGVEFWRLAANNGSKLIVHNAYKYDRPLLEKFYPDTFKTPVEGWHDTLLQSKLQWQARPAVKGSKGVHGLEPYGCRFGIIKPPIKDWSFMDEYKLHRCLEDCRIQRKTYLYLEREAQQLREKLGIDFKEAMGHEVAYTVNTAKQEAVGCPVDVVHIKECVIELGELLTELANEIEPQLPKTLKVANATKVTIPEICKSLGINSKARDKLDKEGLPIKTYYKPSINFTKEIKCSSWGGFSITYGSTPPFRLKKQVVDYIKEKYPDEDPKDWEYEKLETEERVLNKNTCDFFDLEETATDIIVGAHTRIKWSISKLSQDEIVKGFLIQLGLKPSAWNFKVDKDKRKVKADEDTLIRFPPKAHPDHQVTKLVKKGQNMVTSPKLTDDAFFTLPDGLGTKVSNYNSYSHRLRFLENPDPKNADKGLIRAIRDDLEGDRVTAGINVFGASSGRSTHYNLVNLAGKKSLYGLKIRRCIKAPEGKVLVACDMKSAQLSIAAMLACNATYYEAIASGDATVDREDGTKKYVGTSAHCYSARFFGMTTEAQWKEAVRTQDKEAIAKILMIRDGSKEASFSTIFGSGAPALANLLGTSVKSAKVKRQNFLDNLGVSDVIRYAETFFKNKYKRANGYYLPLPFGYWVHCNSDHKILVSFCQGIEAVCQKIAINFYEAQRVLRGIEGNVILQMHDETLIESLPEDAAANGKLIAEAYKYASDECFNWYQRNTELFPNKLDPLFPFNLDGGYEVGTSYDAIH